MLTSDTQQPIFETVLLKHRRWICALIWTLLFSSPFALSAAESESKVKAAYLYNFTTLIKWPGHAFQNEASPLVLGIVGRGETGKGVEKLLDGRTAGSRPIVVKSIRAEDSAALRACNVVFVTDPENTAQVASATAGLPILIVGEAKNFASDGGIIGFVLKNQKIKLEINRTAARKAQLTIPSDLLAIATLVE